MPSQANIGSNIRQSRTVLAALVAICSVVLGLLPAVVIVAIYSFFLKIIVYSAGGSWVPYLDELALEWFPQLLYGLIAGGVAIGVTRYFFKNSNLDIVRFATLAFWGGVIVLTMIILFGAHGLSSELISSMANLIGLGIGLWIAPLSELN